MWNAFLIAAVTNVTWYLLPLAVVISLVYSCSRFELPESNLRRAAKLFITILIVMGLVLALLIVLSP